MRWQMRAFCCIVCFSRSVYVCGGVAFNVSLIFKSFMDYKQSSVYLAQFCINAGKRGGVITTSQNIISKKCICLSAPNGNISN